MWLGEPSIHTLIRALLRREWLCGDYQLRGGCCDDGSHSDYCPEVLLDQAMQTPLGAVIMRACEIDTALQWPGAAVDVLALPADEFRAIKILQIEKAAYQEERRQRDEQAESIRKSGWHKIDG